MTDEVKKDRRKKYKIPMIDPTRPAYYTSPKSPIDLDVVRDTAVVKYNFSEIEKDFTGKTDAEKLEMTYKELVSRLAVESHKMYITEIDWDDGDTVRLRNAQMVNLKNLLSVINGLKSLVKDLKSEATSAELVFHAEAEEMIKKAQALLVRKPN